MIYLILSIQAKKGCLVLVVFLDARVGAVRDFKMITCHY